MRPAASRPSSAFPGRVSVATNEGAKSFRMSTAAIAPDLLVRTAPALDAAAFLEASFKQAEEAPLLPGRVALYRDGIFVGRGQMALTPKDETVPPRLRRRRQGQGRARPGAQERELDRAPVDLQDRRARVQDHGAQRPRYGRFASWSRISSRSARSTRSRSSCCPSQRRRPSATCATGAACWPGASTAAAGELQEIKLGWRVRWPADKSIDVRARAPVVTVRPGPRSGW